MDFIQRAYSIRDMNIHSTMMQKILESTGPAKFCMYFGFWFSPILQIQLFKFDDYERQWERIPNNINILANIFRQGIIDEGSCFEDS